MPDSGSATSKPCIAHVLTMDVVGYSKLLLEEQTRLMSDLNRMVRQSARFRTSDAAGNLIRLPTGDGMALVFFDEPESALESAVEIATSLKTHPDIKVRMGLHSGPVSRIVDVNGQPNVAGAGIDMAHRVMECGDASHILLSKRMASDLIPIVRWNPSLEDIGEATVKHDEKISLVNFHNDAVGNSQVPSKIATARAGVPGKSKPGSLGRLVGAAALICVIGAGVYFYVENRPARESQTLSPPDKSIAVLPFVDLSQAHDQEYFCDGISEEILDALAKVEGLRVVARTSAFSFKGKNADVSEIGRKLNVATVLEGSLRRDGDRIRVTAQLVDARNGFHIWSDTIEKQMQSVFVLQDQVTGAIVDALKIKLISNPGPRPEKDTEAYDLYLRGLFFSNKSDEASLRKSLDFFQRALDKDPNLARAYTGVAKDWYWLSDAYVKPLEAMPAMRAATTKAIALNDKEVDAHCYEAEAKRVLDWDVVGAEAELRRALQLDPNSATAHLYLGLNLGAQGRRAESIEETRRAVMADPLSPIINNMAAVALLANDEPDAAIVQAKRLAEIDPNFVYQFPVLGFAYLQKNVLPDAIDLFKKAQASSGLPQAGLAIAYIKNGQRPEAMAIVGEMERAAAEHYFSGDEIASVYAVLGDNDKAFAWLNRAYEQHASALHAISMRWTFRPLHSDPRFAELLRRIGLDPTRILQQR